MATRGKEAVAGYVRPSWAAWDDEPAAEVVAAEAAKCATSPWYFVSTYCSIEVAARTTSLGESVGGDWVRFELWPAQIDPLQKFRRFSQVYVLKPRQIGLTWLALAFVLWMLLFVPQTSALLFSLRDTEALEMMRRLKGMFVRLPPWLHPAGSFTRGGKLQGESGHQWFLANGATARAFPTSAGDSYTASVAVIDECDLIPKLEVLLSRVKPTVDNGGKLFLISRVDKKAPGSVFKNLWREARAGNLPGAAACFLPWWARPERTRAWYRAQVAHSKATTFSLDAVHESYPATPEEALAASQLDKRFPEDRCSHVFVPLDPVPLARAKAAWDHPTYGKGEARCPASLPGYQHQQGCRVYRVPEMGRAYTIGGDPAQGLRTSCDSALVVVDDESGEEVAIVRGKYTPEVLASYSAALCDWYRKPAGAKCRVMPERNNHGHAFITWWHTVRDRGDYDASLGNGPDGGKGWATDGRSKELMYHRAASRITANRCVVHSRDLYDQIITIEADTLAAPAPLLDDLAVAWGIAIAAADMRVKLGWADLEAA